ncbi:MAG TPA: hypothetical protein PKG54_14270 [Phycisphaerae bacterium]|jgi:hypothetical protein|nr:hypothetical protein [Phycisphaerae bacterium]HOB75679.1 hypothetical protein [Phycisphaerae bacterium]HOJ53291.1 hypothetical protein [Phycisphaerae bacterium]HOL27454.1 hypothetical protein [Phycisphaerae bacterium]HPP21650.1 hypothetical protein [Phycisphaerae bacterium]
MMSMLQRASARWAVGVMLLGGMLLWAGCQQPPCRLNAPPQGHTERPHQLQDQYTYMNDNALLAEMSMSPAHFVPGRADLNALGLRRLTRYAELLAVYPGDLHYDGADPEPLASQRQERIRAFLVDAGVNPNSFKVERGMAGGAGMRADEAVAVRDASTFTEQRAQTQGKGGDWRDDTARMGQ